MTGETGRATTPDEIARMIAGGRSTMSGAAVNSESAMRVAAVYACVRVLADSVAMLPLRLYRKNKDGTHELAGDHFADGLVDGAPNEIHTPFEFKRLVVGTLALRGNAYVWHFMRGTKLAQLIPLHPDRVKVELPAGEMRPKYSYLLPNHTWKVFDPGEIMHFRALSQDGILGMSPIRVAAEAIGLALRSEQHGAALFANAASPAGVLKHPQQLSKPAADRLAASFQEKYSGSENAHKTILLEEGMSWEKVGMTAEESQFIESRKFQRSEIAMFFGIPPHMIGDIERGTSWGSGIEQQGVGFVTYTLLPWLTNIAQACERDLLPFSERRKYQFKFLTDDLTRADFLVRQQGREIQARNGVLSPDEWRRAEGMNPRPDGKGGEYNSAKAAPAQQPKPAAPAPEETRDAA